MVEPLFKYSGPFKAGTEILLDGVEGHHAASVRRMRVGEALQLTDGLGQRARGVVTKVDKRSIVLRLDSVDFEPVCETRLTLIQAIAKGDRDELAIQAATELGVTQVIPWQSERTVSRWEGKEDKGKERCQSIVDEASKQSLRAWFPEVLDVVNTAELAVLVRAAVDDGQIVLVLDPTAETGLGAVSNSAGVAVSVVVGPEGGISEAELSALQEAGAKRVHLGSNILRTSTAGVAAIAWLTASLGVWG